MWWLPASANPLVSALLLQCTLTLIGVTTVVSAEDLLRVSLPDWVLRIDQDGLFRLPSGEHESSVAQRRTDQEDETLLEWAKRMASHDQEGGASTGESTGALTDAFLVIGAKTSVLHGFHHRQAIRQTWASAATTPSDVRVVFLGCEADVSMYAEPQREELRQAIALEKRVFGDLLTSELLQCRDSFANLADKVKAFMLWAVRAYPTLAYAMVVDDDVYVRLDRLLELLHRDTTPRTRFFGGNSASSYYRGLGEPIRDPRNKYYLPSTMYPLSRFPPYLCGGHVIVSRDLVSFIARNFKILRGFKALDDTTLGIWMASLLHVKITYIDAFRDLRYLTTCHEQLISLADLSTVSLRRLHANLLQNGALCDGFDVESWKKPTRTIAVPNVLNAAGALPSDPGFGWDSQINNGTRRFQIEFYLTVAGMTGTFVYTPSFESVGVGFCGRASSLLQERLFVTVGDVWCAYHQRSILTTLDQAATQQPGMRAVLRLTRHNLKHSLASIKKADSQTSNADIEFTSTESNPFLVGLSRCAQSSQVLLESLFVALEPETQVLVFHESEWPTIALDVFVACSRDLPLHPAVIRRAKCVVALEERHNLELLQASHVQSSHAATTGFEWKLFVPTVSRMFSHTVKYSPVDLLQARPREYWRDTTQQGFAIVVSTCESPETTDLESFSKYFTELVALNLSDRCDWNEYARTRFSPLDRFVEDLQQYQFVLVRDAAAVVATFLAGGIPVYCGPTSAGVGGLFNPRAFVDCSLDESLHQCSQQVRNVVESSALMEQMLSQPPIVDDVVFANTFFWHPDANGSQLSDVAAAQHRRHYQRLREMIQ